MISIQGSTITNIKKSVKLSNEVVGNLANVSIINGGDMIYVLGKRIPGK